jgi:hypothetical protein
MSVRRVIVNCYRRGKLIASYPLGHADTIGYSLPPNRDQFIEEAKFNLSQEGLAQPPYAEIEFAVRGI